MMLMCAEDAIERVRRRRFDEWQPRGAVEVSTWRGINQPRVQPLPPTEGRVYRGPLRVVKDSLPVGPAA